MFVVLLFFFFATAQADSDFILDPQSTTVDEGQNVTLSCRLQYFDRGETCSSYKFYWRRTTQKVSREYTTTCKTVHISADRITVSKNGGYYVLNIRGVRSDDAGEYWCYVYYNRIYSYTSERAHLTVRSFPKNPPTCEFLPRPVSVGTDVELRCKLSPLDPPSNLTWVESDYCLPLGSSQFTEPGEYLSACREITEADNHKAFTCVAGPDQRRGPNCTVIPLHVPTNVSVEPFPSRTITEGQSASFRCVSESIPEAYEYRWRLKNSNQSDVKVNLNTVSSLGDRYRLSDNGQVLKIVETSTAPFGNTEIRCIAITTLESMSSEHTRLIVVPVDDLSTQTASTTSVKGPVDPNAGAVGSSSGGIIGGVLGVLILLAVVVVLGCYLTRSRAKRKSANTRSQNFFNLGGIGMTVVQASPTYEELPQDSGVKCDGQSGTVASGDSANNHPHVYDTPDRNVQDETTVNASPIYANSPGYANLPRPNGSMSPSTVDEKRPSSGQVIYASPDKRKGPANSRPDPIGSEAAASSEHSTDGVPRQDHDPKLKNAEGLVYADLEIETPRPRLKNDTPQESISYASIRGDMAEVKRMLNRD